MRRRRRLGHQPDNQLDRDDGRLNEEVIAYRHHRTEEFRNSLQEPQRAARGSNHPTPPPDLWPRLHDRLRERILADRHRPRLGGLSPHLLRWVAAVAGLGGVLALALSALPRSAPELPLAELLRLPTGNLPGNFNPTATLTWTDLPDGVVVPARLETGATLAIVAREIGPAETRITGAYLTAGQPLALWVEYPSRRSVGPIHPGERHRVNGRMVRCWSEGGRGLVAWRAGEAFCVAAGRFSRQELLRHAASLVPRPSEGKIDARRLGLALILLAGILVAIGRSARPRA